MDIANSFRDNLLVEDRYRMILDGLQVTLLITLFAALLGTLLGGVVCWARMSRYTFSVTCFHIYPGWYQLIISKIIRTFATGGLMPDFYC